MSEIITPVVYQLGLGAVGGFVVGFALKKIAKLFIVVLGIFIVALLYLGVSNIISINFGALWSAVGGGAMIIFLTSPESIKHPRASSGVLI